MKIRLPLYMSARALNVIFCSVIFCFTGSCLNVQAQSAADLAYRNAVTPPPPGWTGPVFQLSHNYPTADPGPCSPKVCKWLANKKVNFNLPLTGPAPTWGPAWNNYIQAILDYVKQEQDPELQQVSVQTRTWRRRIMRLLCRV